MSRRRGTWGPELASSVYNVIDTPPPLSAPYALQDVLAQVAIFYDRIQPLLDHFGIYHEVLL